MTLTPTSRPELARDTQWQRLDLRMLLVHPVRELIRFLPALVVLLLAGGRSGGVPYEALAIVVPVVLGLLRYLTTTFRVAAGRVELRRGLLSRHVLSTPVDRVRTVDLTSSPIHWLLGLTTVRIGTGTAAGDHEERLDLDGLPMARARELRVELLQVSPVTADTYDEGASGPAAPDRVVLRLDPRWARFAPLTSSGLVIAAAALGGLSQLVNVTGGDGWLDPDRVADDVARVVAVPLWVLVPVGVLLFAAVVSVLSVIGYLVTNWGFVMTRAGSADGATWQLQRGLFTTRETTLDEDRVAGVVVGEPAALRLVGAARLTAIVTGQDRGQRGSSILVPPAPWAVVARVTGDVLGSSGPADHDLLRHGPRAVRRRWTRALGPAAVIAVGAVVLVVTGASAWVLAALVVLPLAALLAADRSRSLGHALTDGFLLARSGSVVRRREALAVEHVIGWNLSATWFQRRAGLTSLAATTAGGSQSVTVLDVPEETAVSLASRSVPGLLGQFVV